MTQITIPGRPIPLRRHRHNNNKAYDPQKKEKFYYGILLKRAFNHEPLCSPLHVTLIFRFKIPKRERKKIAPNHPYDKHVDLDNLTKWVLDCGNDILWKDDSIICSINAIKVYGETEETIIKIENITNGKKEW